MSTFKEIEKYYKIKKVIILLTVILAILDMIIGFVNPAYLLSSSSFIGLGVASYFFVKEYEEHQIEHKKMSKAILLFSLVLAGFSIYYLVLNLINMLSVSV